VKSLLITAAWWAYAAALGVLGCVAMDALCNIAWFGLRAS
jgi:hypothetical protein